MAQGAGVTATVGEPTVANDRNGLLYTGNFHAALSDDNGLSWSFLNPATQFASIKGGFCCDQVAYAVDRGDSSLVFWLLQYRDDGVTGGALRLVVYEGRSELLSQANYCEHVITPATINEQGVKWFDFNVMSSTDEHLFISSKVFDSATGAHVTGAVIKWDLADFEDGDCSLDSGLVYKNADGPAQNTALAQGADSTMYWGKRTANGQIDVWELPDSTDTATRRTKAVSTWAASGRGQSHCPVPDGTDPCARANDKLNVAFLHEGKLGFAWNVAEGNGFPFPHIRMARFDLPSMNLADEPDIWHPDYAWTYAAAGVSAAGHLGLSLYRIGGGEFPRARVALVDDVDTNIDSLNVHGVISSDAGTFDPTGAVIGRWGDYAAVRPYGNCANTFAGTVHSQQGGNLNQDSEHRFVWFGREGDGCADLVISDLAFLPTTVRRGESLLVAQTTRNIGSATAGSSTTRVYLSRDATHSDDDLRLDETASHGSLDRGESQGLGIGGEVPAAAFGAYYVIVVRRRHRAGDRGHQHQQLPCRGNRDRPAQRDRDRRGARPEHAPVRRDRRRRAVQLDTAHATLERRRTGGRSARRLALADAPPDRGVAADPDAPHRHRRGRDGPAPAPAACAETAQAGRLPRDRVPRPLPAASRRRAVSHRPPPAARDRATRGRRDLTGPAGAHPDS